MESTLSQNEGLAQNSLYVTLQKLVSMLLYWGSCHKLKCLQGQECDVSRELGRATAQSRNGGRALRSAGHCSTSGWIPLAWLTVARTSVASSLLPRGAAMWERGPGADRPPSTARKTGNPDSLVNPANFYMLATTSKPLKAPCGTESDFRRQNAVWLTARLPASSGSTYRLSRFLT